jgi:hypothetical protein
MYVGQENSQIRNPNRYYRLLKRYYLSRVKQAEDRRKTSIEPVLPLFGPVVPFAAKLGRAGLWDLKSGAWAGPCVVVRAKQQQAARQGHAQRSEQDNGKPIPRPLAGRMNAR